MAISATIANHGEYLLPPAKFQSEIVLIRKMRKPSLRAHG